MGQDVRLAYPEEVTEKRWKKVMRPVLWMGGAAALAMAVFFLPRLLATEDRSTSGLQVQAPVGAGGSSAQQIKDQDPAVELPGPGGTTAEVPAGGKVLPPGTSTLPPVAPGSARKVGTGSQDLRPPAPSVNPATGTFETTVFPITGGTKATNLTPTLSELILTPNPDLYEGRRIAVYRGEVQYVAGNKAFAIGSSKSRYMWVVMDDSSSAHQRQGWPSIARPGKRVYVDGVLSRVPRSEASRMFGVDGSSARVGTSQLYIRARAVETFRP